MDVDFNEYRLTKWRRLLLVRDCVTIQTRNGPIRMAHCQMCNNTFPVYRMQAHHIRPKSLYPHLAYELRNGIMLNLSCHMELVHGGNSFEDMKEHHRWRFFQPAFDRYVDLAINRRFNESNQHRV